MDRGDDLFGRRVDSLESLALDALDEFIVNEANDISGQLANGELRRLTGQ